MSTKRKLNVALIKSVVMFFFTIPIAMGSALSGIGALAVMIPTVEFMLDFKGDKLKATALMFTLFTSVTAVYGAVSNGVRFQFSEALIIAFGATVGAAIFRKKMPDARLRQVQRIGNTGAILVALITVSEVARQRIGGPLILHIPILSDSGMLLTLSMGFVAGALSHLGGISSGMLLVPFLLFTRPRATSPVSEAVVLAIAVVAVASALPTVLYAARKAVDSRVGPWMCFGGAIGGFLGGIFLSKVGPIGTIPMVVFAFTTMVLSARTLYKMSS